MPDLPTVRQVPVTNMFDSYDENQAAADFIRQTVAKHVQRLPPDVEAAWRAWSAGVGKLDERAMSLLRAAFEAGVEAARKQDS